MRQLSCKHMQKLPQNIRLEMLGIEPRTSYMQSTRSTTELHPHVQLEITLWDAAIWTEDLRA